MPLAKPPQLAAIGSMICLTLCSVLSPFTHAFQPPEAVDRPTQRWLPLPEGDEIDLSGQARLLQQLRDLMSTESNQSPLPKLSEQQLQQMEKTLNQLREQFGAEGLPNLEDIPPQWINQALSDPLVRKQAQQLLEQYARDRQLPTGGGGKQTLNSKGVPFPRREPAASSSNGNSSRNAPPQPISQSPIPPPLNKPSPPNSSDIPQAGERPGPLPSERSAAQLPRLSDPAASEADRSDAKPRDTRPRETESLATERLDAERIDALKELFQKLKAIEGMGKADQARARSAETPLPDSKSGENPRSAKSSMKSGVTPGTQVRPAAPSATDRKSAAGGKNGVRPDSTGPGRNTGSAPTGRTPQPDSVSPGSPGTRGSLPSASENDADTVRDSQRAPQQLAPNLDRPAAQPAAVKPVVPETQAKPSNRVSPPSSQRLGSDGGENRPNAAEGSPRNALPPSQGKNGNPVPAASADRSSASKMDIKTQLERQGLGRALQSLVEKTLKEQGQSTSDQPPAARDRRKDATSKTIERPRSHQPDNPSAMAPPAAGSSRKPPEAASGRSATLPAARPQDPTSANAAPAMSGLGDLATEIWGAIRSAPSENEAVASAPSAAGATVAPAPSLGFTWNGRVGLLCVLAGLAVVLALLLARKRLVLAAAAREAEASVAKEILAEGIRTRADVVRAFHRFVLRRAQPVATWWNHRYVVSRLTESSPQLGAVILDLASVYEHARYLPPDVELSSDQIDRVNSALRQCVASSV